MKSLYASIQPIRFRLTILGLLLGATFASVVLFRLRTVLSGTADYALLIWNIFLAWVPPAIAYLASQIGNAWRFRSVAIIAAAGLWLLFFPNAPYILTDVQHLSYARPEIPVWYDSLLLLWFAWTGLLLGIVSLAMMQRIVRQAFGRAASWMFVLTACALASTGIYLGRFLRWNSWDLLLHPLERLSEFMYYALHPSAQSLIFMTTFASLFLFIYASFYAFSLFAQENTAQVRQENT